MAQIKKKTSDFYERVYEVVACIPYGCVTTYGSIAGLLGVRSGARMVGYALNNLLASPRSPEIPAHRVVNRIGELSGRAYFPNDTMRERLVQEGVEFVEEYRINIKKHYWNPELC